MITKKVTFIVGAGASNDLGFPIGNVLKSEISSDFFRILKGRSETNLGTLSYALGRAGDGTNEIATRLKYIAENVVRAASIDNFLDNNRDDALILQVGKAGIAKCIAKYEEKSSISESVIGNGHWSASDEFFLGNILHHVVRGHTKDDIESSLKNLGFVIFNYDRCVERYLDLWLSNNFGTPFKEKVRQNVKFVHIYGSVGDYFKSERFSLRSSEHTFFLNEHLELPNVIDRIKIFTEQKDSEVVGEANNLISEADVLMFLGFAFEEQNMSLFESQNNESKRKKAVF